MKKFLAVFLAALMLFTLAACGAKEEETTAPPETTAEETTTAAPAEGEPIATQNGYATIEEAGNWEYKGEYAPGMLEFADKTVPGSKIYISEKQGLEAQKKSVEYAYTDKAFEEVKIGENTYSFMQAKDGLAYLIAPVSAEGDFCLYIQINGGTLEDAKPLIETIVIK
ncbi:MAG: hypothetical protein IJ962_02105 [Clostridia bacterium]|nr:hypothetical protein [Clostridia bacterium]MBR6568242.1 hypothetical protein [Clostridia bacterium]